MRNTPVSGLYIGFTAKLGLFYFQFGDLLFGRGVNWFFDWAVLEADELLLEFVTMVTR
jgi:hypothetical protein